ncbi:NAD(P)-binding protein [Nemania sp. NC0429]|nr:NAD(P)-binding protein [Nemania sp. NC0429]
MQPSKIFITGATGFIGSHSADAALKAGHNVRLSIRKAEQQQRLERTFANHLSQVEFVVVPDITTAEAFRDALLGVDYVWHLASPMPGSGSNIRSDFVEPAVNATLAILDAALAHKTIKKVIVMSSVLGLMPFAAPADPRLTILDNTGEVLPVDLSIPLPEGFGGQFLSYHASKILAHQAYRDWVKQHNPEFDAISLHPVYVLGPDILQEKAEELAGVNSFIWRSLHSEKPALPPSFVDVRDVAASFVLASEKDVQRGVEYLLAGPEVSWQDIVDIVKSQYPSIEVKLVPPFDVTHRVVTERVESDLGLRWRSIQTSISSILDQQLAFLA